MKKVVIILAAGFGSRLTPLTLDKPKALLKINGQETIIESILKPLSKESGFDVYIITGYKYKKLYDLIVKYNLKEIKNKKYNNSNSIYSLYLALKNININEYEGFYIVPCDCFLKTNIFDKNFNYSWVNTVKTNHPNNEWKIIKNSDGNIKEFNSSKDFMPYDNEYITGATYLKYNDFLKLKEVIIEKVENNFAKYRDKYWEYGLKKILNNIQLKPFDLTEKLVEIDSIEDLKKIDSSNYELNKSIYLQKILSFFKTSINDIVDIKPIKMGMTNDSFTFVYNGKNYISRIPGQSSQNFINRLNEFKTYENIKNYRYAEPIVFFDNSKNSKSLGQKISFYLKEYKNIDIKNKQQVKKAIEAIREFHNQNYQVDYEFDILEQIHHYKNLISDAEFLKKFDSLEKDIIKIYMYIKAKNYPQQLIHVDFICDNVLYDEQKDDVKLIDWEYAGRGDKFFDLSSWCLYSYYDKRKVDDFLKMYLDRQPTKEDKIHIYAFLAMQGYLWFLWSVYKEKQNLFYDDYKDKMLGYAIKYRELINELTN